MDSKAECFAYAMVICMIESRPTSHMRRGKPAQSEPIHGYLNIPVGESHLVPREHHFDTDIIIVL